MTHILHTALASPVRLHSLEMRGKKIFDFTRRTFPRACDLVKVRSVCFELPLLTDRLNKQTKFLKRGGERGTPKSRKKSSTRAIQFATLRVGNLHTTGFQAEGPGTLNSDNQ